MTQRLQAFALTAINRGKMEQRNEQHPHGGTWLREIVFGLNDGLVTTLVFLMVVSGVASSNLLLIMLGEVMAGGVSMALGGYLSARTEQEEERAELRAIYRHKGIRGPLLDRIVNHLTANEERWHQALIHDELGVVEGKKIKPWWQGLQVGISFVIGGLIPTIPVLLSLPQTRWWAYGLTALTAMGLGAIKARYIQKGPVRAGLEFLVVVTLGTLAGVGARLLLYSRRKPPP